MKYDILPFIVGAPLAFVGLFYILFMCVGTEPKVEPQVRPIDNYLLNLEYQQVTNYIASEARYLSYSPADYMTNYGKHKAKYEAEIIQRNWYQLIKQNNKTSTEDDPIEIFMIELEYVMIKFILGRSKHHEEELENYEAVLNG